MKQTKFLSFVLLVFCLWAAPGQADVWDKVRSGEALVLMRHAYAPGMGDPDNFKLGDCTTQRNLNHTGREQAVDVGRQLRAKGIKNPRVFTSQWCRCKETAELLGFGQVNPKPELNSFFQAMHREEQQTKAVIDWLSQRPPNGPSILVTHQVNITGLTGYFPSSGELVIVSVNTDGDVTIEGKVLFEK